MDHCAAEKAIGTQVTAVIGLGVMNDLVPISLQPVPSNLSMI